jgi:hypothetical protein
MDSTKILLPYDILDIIWKKYYSQYILPIIQNKKESKLYINDNCCKSNYVYLNYSERLIFSQIGHQYLIN